jgi:hypothetical protein
LGLPGHGRLDASGSFIADEAFAKPNEKYVRLELARSLKQPGVSGRREVG